MKFADNTAKINLSGYYRGISGGGMVSGQWDGKRGEQEALFYQSKGIEQGRIFFALVESVFESLVKR